MINAVIDLILMLVFAGFSGFMWWEYHLSTIISYQLQTITPLRKLGVVFWSTFVVLGSFTIGSLIVALFPALRILRHILS